MTATARPIPGSYPTDLERGQNLIRNAEAMNISGGPFAPDGVGWPGLHLDAEWREMHTAVDALQAYAGPALAAPVRERWRAMAVRHEGLVERARELAAEVGNVRRDYLGACQLVAEMHRAGYGRVTGPVHHGVVEDIAALGGALRDVLDSLTSNPSDPDPVDAMDLTTARNMLRSIRDVAGHALHGPQPPQPLDSDVDPGPTIADVLAADGPRREDGAP